MPSVPKPEKPRTRHFIYAWRKHRDLTQIQVADRIGMSQSTFSRIERGEVPYDQHSLEAIADALSCEVWDLLQVDPRKDGEVVDLVNLIRAADPNNRRRTIAALKAFLSA